MSLGDLLSAYLGVISQEMVHHCDLDPEINEDTFRILRYHGHAIAEDWCRSDTLSAWWENMRPKNPRDSQCAGFPVVTLVAKYQSCWTVSKDGKSIPYTENDAEAARLAEIAECVSRRLIDVACISVSNGVNEDDDPTASTFLSIADKPTFLGCAPTGANGAAAGITWRVDTGIFVVPTIVGPEPQAFLRTVTDGLNTDSV